MADLPLGWEEKISNSTGKGLYSDSFIWIPVILKIETVSNYFLSVRVDFMGEELQLIGALLWLLYRKLPVSLPGFLEFAFLILPEDGSAMLGEGGGVQHYVVT